MFPADRTNLVGSVDFIGSAENEITPAEWAAIFAERTMLPEIRPDKDLPDDARHWAASQKFGCGTWGGCVYDVDAIVRRLDGRD